MDAQLRALHRQLQLRVRLLWTPVDVHQLAHQALEFRLQHRSDAAHVRLRARIVHLANAAAARLARAQHQLLRADLLEDDEAQVLPRLQHVALVAAGRKHPLQVPAARHHDACGLVVCEAREDGLQLRALLCRQLGLQVIRHRHRHAGALALERHAHQLEQRGHDAVGDVPDGAERREARPVVAAALPREEQHRLTRQLDAQPLPAARPVLTNRHQLARLRLHPRVGGERVGQALGQLPQGQALAARQLRTRRGASHRLQNREARRQHAARRLRENGGQRRLETVREVPAQEVRLRLQLRVTHGLFGQLKVHARVANGSNDEVDGRGDVRIRPARLFPLTPLRAARRAVARGVAQRGVGLDLEATAVVGRATEALLDDDRRDGSGGRQAWRATEECSDAIEEAHGAHREAATPPEATSSHSVCVWDGHDGHHGSSTLDASQFLVRA